MNWYKEIKIAMPIAAVITPEQEKEIVELYKTMHLAKIAKMYHTSNGKIKDFLATGDIKKFLRKNKKKLQMSSVDIEAINHYKNNNPKLFKLLLRRIYNEVINGNNNR